MTFVKIFDDNKTVTASIFALREGCSLPVHDHPHMYGFIKCIYGSVNITTYSKIQQKELASSQSSHGDSPGVLRLSASKVSDVCLTEASQDVAIVKPDTGNIHSISAVNGPGAFIDFLTPPYNNTDRDCHYYHVESESVSDVFTLQEVPCPSWYWCATESYRGPCM